MAFRWAETTVTLPDGQRRPALAPLIISASRATDIPAFHAAWLMERLAAGYVEWVNPFNQQRRYIALTQAKVLVFWTKNPQPLLPYLPEIEARGLHYYVQFTLNDYAAEGWEPGVPPLEERLAVFQALSRRLGKARVIWRFDPLLLGPALTLPELLARVERLGNVLHTYTEKLVISFADLQAYAKVRRRLAGSGCRELTPAEMTEAAGRIGELAKHWGITAATCAEAQDWSAYGVVPNACVDLALIRRCFGTDPALAVLWPPQPLALFDEATQPPPVQKDSGQRKACGCFFSKDIGQYDTCPHLCCYCYANSTAARVRQRLGGNGGK